MYRVRLKKTRYIYDVLQQTFLMFEVNLFDSKIYYPFHSVIYIAILTEDVSLPSSKVEELNTAT